MTLLQASAMGEPALRILESGGQAQVIGMTSRGVFLHHEKGQVIFLSFEGWRGPMTINLLRDGEVGERNPWGPTGFRKDSPPFDRMQPGCSGQITQEAIDFPSSALRIAIHGLESARLCVHAPEPFEKNKILARLRRTSRLVAAARAGKGWSGLLACRLGEKRADELPAELAPANRSLEALLQGLRAQSLEIAMRAAGAIAGLGNGLTPSGDDVLIGLLLGFQALQPGLQSRIPGFVEAVVALAYQKTTALSASLMECAASGQADERIVSAVDGISSGHLTAGECARLLLSYGGSSGGDTLLGVLLVSHLI